MFLFFRFCWERAGRGGLLTAIATPGLADLVVDVLGGGGRLGLDRLGDDGFPLLHCHDGSIEEGKEGGERCGGEEWRRRRKKRKREKEQKSNLSSFIEQTRAEYTHAVFESTPTSLFSLFSLVRFVAILLFVSVIGCSLPLSLHLDPRPSFIAIKPPFFYCSIHTNHT